MPKLSVRDIDLKGKRIFMRVDFNVPLNDAGEITDDTRIQASLPTIQYIVERGGRLILASHLGRPKGKVNPKMSLKPAATRLAQVLGKPVAFAADCIGRKPKPRPRRSKTATCCCLKTCASIRKKKRTCRSLRRSLPRSPRFTWTTRSVPRIAPTPPRRASLTTFPLARRDC